MDTLQMAALLAGQQKQTLPEGETPPAAPAQDYWGDRPGLDLGDIIPFIGERGSVAGHALEVPLTALDTFARPVRTMLSTGDVGRSFESIYNPEQAVSATDLRKQYLFDDVGTQGNGFINGWNPAEWDWGDVIDFAGDMGTGIVTDPLSLATLGTTSAGKNVAQAGSRASMRLLGREIPEAMQAAGTMFSGVDDATRRAYEQAARQRVIGDIGEQFSQATGKALPIDAATGTLPANFTGMEKGLLNSMSAGEKGLNIGLPFGIGPQYAVPLQNKAAQIAATAFNPIDAALDVLKETPLGMKVGQYADKVIAGVMNPAVRDLFGRGMKSAEDLGHTEARIAISEAVTPAYQKLTNAGVPVEQWHLAEDILQSIDPEAVVDAATFNAKTGGKYVNQGAGAKYLREQYDRAAAEVLKMTPEQQAAIYSAAHTLREGYGKAWTTLKKYNPELTNSVEQLRARPKEIAAKLDEIEGQLSKSEMAGLEDGGYDMAARAKRRAGKVAEWHAAPGTLDGQEPVRHGVDDLRDYLKRNPEADAMMVGIDIKGQKAINDFFADKGSNAAADKEAIAPIIGIIEEELKPLGLKVNKFKTGGDEFAFFVVSPKGQIDPEIVREATKRSQDRIRDLLVGKGIDPNIANPRALKPTYKPAADDVAGWAEYHRQMALYEAERGTGVRVAATRVDIDDTFDKLDARVGAIHKKMKAVGDERLGSSAIYGKDNELVGTPESVRKAHAWAKRKAKKANVTAQTEHNIASEQAEWDKMMGEQVDELDAPVPEVVPDLTPEDLVQRRLKAAEEVRAKPADKFGEEKNLIEQRDKLREELAQATRTAEAVPSYSPGIVAKEARPFLEPKRVGSSSARPAGQGEKSYIHGKKIGDPSLEGAPMTNRQIREHEARVGSRATGYEVPSVRQLMSKEGFLKAKKQIPLLTDNPIEAATEYFKNKYARTITTSQMNKSVTNAFKTIDDAAWQQVAELAHGGASFDDVNATLKKLTGYDAKDLMSKETLDRLATGERTVDDIFSAAGGPGEGAWAKIDDFNGQGKSVFVPKPVKQRYETWRTASTQRLGETISRMLPPYTAFMNIWKKGQVLWPNSQIRNQIGDMFRMIQTGAIDFETANDMAKLWGPLKDGALNGAMSQRNFGLWRDTMFTVGNGAQINGEELMRLAEKHGVFDTGREAEILMEGATKQAKTDLGKRAEKMVGGTWDKVKNAYVHRENTNRVAAFAASLRQGLDPFEAALKVEETLFNQARISPAADFLRKTGIAPFISWQAKNLPAQIEYAITHPGHFAAMLRGFEMLQGQEMPEDLLPKYLKDKYNIVLMQQKGDDGKMQWVYTTNSGIIPMTDLAEIMRSPPNQYGAGAVKEWLGPFAKTAMEWATGEYAEDEGKTLGQAAVENLGGRLYSVPKKLINAGQVDPYTGLKTPGTVVEAMQLLSPSRIKSLDVEARIERADKAALSDLNRAKGKMRQMMERSNQAALMYENDPGSLQSIQQAAAEATAAFNRQQAEYQKTTAENARVREKIRVAKLVP